MCLSWGCFSCQAWAVLAAQHLSLLCTTSLPGCSCRPERKELCRSVAHVCQLTSSWDGFWCPSAHCHSFIEQNPISCCRLRAGTFSCPYSCCMSGASKISVAQILLSFWICPRGPRRSLGARVGHCRAGLSNSPDLLESKSPAGRGWPRPWDTGAGTVCRHQPGPADVNSCAQGWHSPATPLSSAPCRTFRGLYCI